MKSISFHLENVKVPSVNESKAIDFKTKRQFKTKKYDEFEKTIKYYCMQKTQDINEFEASFDVNKSHLSFKAIFWIPKDKMFVKKGYISNRSGDFDNYLKCSVDSIFKSFNKLDDKYIKHVEKIDYLVAHDSNYGFILKLTERDNSLLYQLGEL